MARTQPSTRSDTARSRPCTQPCTHAYVYTAVTKPCTRHIHGRVHGQYTAVYTAVYTGHVHGPYTALYMFVCTGRVHGRVHGPSCTWQVGLPGHVHVPRRHATAVCGPSRPCKRPVHGSVYGRVRRPLHGPPTHAYVYTAVKRPCTRHVHVRVHGRDGTLRPWAMYTAVRRHVHGRVRPIHSRVHVRLHGPHTWTVCRNGPHTALVWERVHGPVGKPTCRIHGPDDPCTRRVTAKYTGRYMAYTPAVYALCRRPKTAVYTASVHGRKWP